MLLAEKINKFNSRASEHIEKQSLNPFSGRFNRSPSPRLSKEEYGRPVAGSKTEERGQKAKSHINREILELCNCIHDIGTYNLEQRRKDPDFDRDEDDGTIIVTFGELFQIYTKINDKVVGLLIAAKKRGFVYFEKEILFQRRDDDVMIALIKPIQEIREVIRELLTPSQAPTPQMSRTPSPGPSSTAEDESESSSRSGLREAEGTSPSGEATPLEEKELPKVESCEESAEGLEKESGIKIVFTVDGESRRSSRADPSQENPDRISTDDPVKAEEDPVKAEEDPVKAEEDPVKAEEDPVKAEEDPVKAEEDPVKAEEDPVKAEEDPVKAEEDPVKAEEDPVKAEEDPVKAEEDPVKAEEDPVKAEEDPVKAEEDPVKAEEDPVRAEEDPVRADGPEKSESEQTLEGVVEALKIHEAESILHDAERVDGAGLEITMEIPRDTTESPARINTDSPIEGSGAAVAPQKDTIDS